MTEWKHLNLNYKIVARIDEQKCIGCDLCHIACWDGAHQCIHLDRVTGPVDGHVELHRTPAMEQAESLASIAETPVTRKERAAAFATGPYPTPLERIPRVDETECVGCNLCSLVCPVDGCITMVQRGHRVEAGDVGRTDAGSGVRSRVASGKSETEERGRRIVSTTLIQNGTIVNADASVKADLLIDGAMIKEVRAGIPASAADKVVDATGLLVLPGGIDAHTHLDMPFGGSKSADDFETGTRAAAIGGTTTIVDFAIQAKGTKMRDGAGYVVEEGRREGVHRLWAAHDRDGPWQTRAWKTWTTWCARAWPASSCSWRIPTC